MILHRGKLTVMVWLNVLFVLIPNMYLMKSGFLWVM